jgi:hypothetical protein
MENCKGSFVKKRKVKLASVVKTCFGVKKEH